MIQDQVGFISHQDLYHLGNLERENLFFDLSKAKESYEALLLALEADEFLLYGIHTHFGANIEQSVSTDYQTHQKNLLNYLRVGVGKELPESVVRRALRLQLHKVIKGFSAVHPKTIEKLDHLSRETSLPKVPREGSLGASGDLIPMAHAVEPIFKEGILGPKDVLGLVNTNSMMVSWATHHYQRIRLLFEKAIEVSALVKTSTGSSSQSRELLLYEEINGNNKCLKETAKSMLQIEERLESQSAKLPFLDSHQALQIQPRYSIRCAPLIYSNIEGLMKSAEALLLSEAHLVSDNPLIFKDKHEVKVMHGGLFYAQGVASASDQLSDCVGRMAENMDRQVLILMDTHLNGGLPQNLEWEEAGSLKGLHQLISSLCQKIRGMSLPSRLMSFSCESNNQDMVPCAMAHLNVLDELLNSLTHLLDAALFCAKRAWSLRYKGECPKMLYLSEWKNRK